METNNIDKFEDNLVFLIFGYSLQAKRPLASQDEKEKKQFIAFLSSTENGYLQISNVDQILIFCAKNKTETNDLSPSFLFWLGECFNRSTENYIMAKGASLGVTLDEDQKAYLASIQDTILNFAILFTTVPDALEPQPSQDYIVNSALTLFRSPVMTRFTQALVERLEQEDSLKSIVDLMIQKIYSNLDERCLTNPCQSTVSEFFGLCRNKSLVDHITANPIFLPPQKQSTMQHGRLRSRDGWDIQFNSLMGRLLAPTPLDDGVAKKGFDTHTRYIAPLSMRFLSKQHTNSITSTIRQEVLGAVDSVTDSMKQLFRGQKARGDLFTLLRRINDANSHRGSLAAMYASNVMPVGGPFVHMANKIQGLSGAGFNINIMMCLLKLAEPIKPQKVDELDPYFSIREDETSFKEVLGNLSTSERLGDLDGLAECKKFYFSENQTEIQDEEYLFKKASSTEPKFITQIFWTTLRAIKSLLIPSLMEFERVERKVMETPTGPAFYQQLSNSKEADKFLMIFGSHLRWSALFKAPGFHTSICSFINLFFSWFLYWTTNVDHNGKLRSDKSFDIRKISKYLLSTSDTERKEVPLPSKSFPSDLIEAVMETVKYLFQFSGGDVKALSIDPTLLTAVCLQIMTSEIVPAPNRWSCGSKALLFGHSIPNYKNYIESNPISCKLLLPATIQSFIDAQKSTYYGRIQERLHYTRLLESLFLIPDYRAELVEIAEKRNENFVRFVHLFVSHLSWLVDESMSTLAELKKREDDTAMGKVIAADQRNEQSSNENAEPSALETADDSVAANVDQVNTEELQKLCVDLMSGFTKSLCFFTTLCRTVGHIIRKTDTLLSQCVLSLNSVIDHLVGPRCLKLKVRNYEKYDFRPRELMASVVGCYLVLVIADHEDEVQEEEFNVKVLKEISKEPRYFKIESFVKAHNVVNREGFLPTSRIKDFGKLVEALKLEKQKRVEEDSVMEMLLLDMPEEYLDPLMQEIMEDPVLLPTSKNIMDRRHIERHLLSEQFDPFNRQPLQITDLVPQEILKKEIREYVDQQKKNQNVL
eukprot:GHVP01048998.1.p1 GENE.GHVP01048998.1~~GHVP01048998.1.p1  ORF type:complete len:1059 (+),score=181.35 GHVP01048998.1:41-3178(+)